MLPCVKAANGPPIARWPSAVHVRLARMICIAPDTLYRRIAQAGCDTCRRRHSVGRVVLSDLEIAEHADDSLTDGCPSDASRSGVIRRGLIAEESRKDYSSCGGIHSISELRCLSFGTVENLIGGGSQSLEDRR
jgi:hypothetical protein